MFLNIGLSFTGLIILICHIVVIVKMFQNNQAALGIITLILTPCCGIGFIVSIIMGWVKGTEWQIRPIILLYSVAVIAYIALIGMNIGPIMEQYREIRAQWELQRP
jgi:uncharacterized membrane-anchored protein